MNLKGRVSRKFSENTLSHKGYPQFVFYMSFTLSFMTRTVSVVLNNNNL